VGRERERGDKERFKSQEDRKGGKGEKRGSGETKERRTDKIGKKERRTDKIGKKERREKKREEREG